MVVACSSFSLNTTTVATKTTGLLEYLVVVTDRSSIVALFLDPSKSKPSRRREKGRLKKPLSFVRSFAGSSLASSSSGDVR